MEVLKVFNDYLGGIIVLSSWVGIENLIICNRFGVVGSLLNNFWKVLEFFGMIMKVYFLILVVRSFLIFSFLVISTVSVCSKLGLFWWCVCWCYVYLFIYYIFFYNCVSK